MQINRLIYFIFNFVSNYTPACHQLTTPACRARHSIRSGFAGKILKKDNLNIVINISYINFE
jgi:hypothetical protein